MRWTWRGQFYNDELTVLEISSALSAQASPASFVLRSAFDSLISYAFAERVGRDVINDADSIRKEMFQACSGGYDNATVSIIASRPSG